MVFRTKKTGDVIGVKNGNKKVKDVLTEQKVPRWKRGSLYMLAEGADIQTALRTAAKASSIAVTRVGAAPSIPTMEEVEASLREG